MMKVRNDKKKNKIPYITLTLVCCFLLYRCFYSFCWSDESYYLALVHRLWLGESLITDEWFTSQLFAPLLLPFYTLFELVRGNNEGVYLFFRLLAVFWSYGLSLYMYTVLQKKNARASSLAASLIFLLYCRANIGGMSYYNMTLAFTLWALLLLYNKQEERKGTIRLLGAGFLFAMAVVCTPHLGIFYVCIWLLLLLIPGYRQYHKQMYLLMLGTLLAAVLYMGWLFSNMSLQELVVNVPHILNEPELMKAKPWMAVIYFFVRVAWRFRYTILLIGAGYLYPFGKRWICKKTITEKEEKILLSLALILFVLNAYFARNMVGCINIALVLFTVQLALLEGKRDGGRTLSGILSKDIVTILKFFLMPGIVLVLAFSLSSDTGLDAMTIGYVLIAIAAVLSMQHMRMLEKKYVRVILITVVALTILQSGYLRMFSVYRDSEIEDLKVQIEEGPARFLFTGERKAWEYQELKDAITENVREEDRVFYTRMCSYAYLFTNNHYGTPSSWRLTLDSPRLKEYFIIYPEKIPTFVMVLEAECGSYESALIQGQEKVWIPNKNIRDGFLWDYIQAEDYEKIITNCAVIFRKQEVE